ncbi:MAG: hypothetical protein ACR2HC_09355 [Thermoleophilaceae bacterium]
MPLPPADQLALERAFAVAPDLWRRIGDLCSGFVPLGAHHVFVRAFVRVLRTTAPIGDPERVVLGAALTALRELSCPR